MVTRLKGGEGSFGKVYTRASLRKRNELNRALVAIVGEHPVLVRDGEGKGAVRAPIRIAWPQITLFTAADRASCAWPSSASASGADR